jgi:hypothetical protein
MGHPAIDRHADECVRRYVPHLNPLRRTSVIYPIPADEAMMGKWRVLS